MVRLLTLAVLGGFAALWATSTVEANEGAQAAAPAAAVSQAPAAAAAPAAAPARVAAPRRTYRRYSYSPTTTSSGLRGYRGRAYTSGFRDAASKSLGVNQPFHR